MQVSRRLFLGGMGAFGAFGAFSGCRFLRGTAKAGTPQLTFGVVSDVHVRLDKSGKGIEKTHSVETLVKTLTWFRDQGVDAVMIAGDIADHGMVGELQAVADAWFQVFPNDKAPDGRSVARLFVAGNHDWEGYKYGKFAETVFPDAAERAKQVLAADYKGNWERIWQEPFAPVWKKCVKGYDFVGGHWTADRCRGKDEVGIAGVEDFFAAHGKEIDPSRPFFYFQHPHPKDTCYGAAAWGRDCGQSTKALSPFSNAIAFSGHSHYTLTDERSVWQGAFTSIGTASLRYTCDYEEALEGGYENKKKGSLMPKIETFDNRQGLLVKVFDDQVALTRRDFMRDAGLGDDWVMPLPVAENRPFAFAARAKALGAPAFPEGAQAVAAETTVGKNKKAALKVAFPAALAAKTRVYDYVVRFAFADGKEQTFHLLAPGYHRAVTDPEATASVDFVLARDRLPADLKGATVTVLPRSSHGVLGGALKASV